MKWNIVAFQVVWPLNFFTFRIDGEGNTLGNVKKEIKSFDSDDENDANFEPDGSSLPAKKKAKKVSIILK